MENFEFIKKNEEIIKNFREVRRKSGEKEYIRNMVIKETTLLFDKDSDQNE
jgi:hypothetical protein